MQSKQLYASIEITEGEIRLLVAEHYMSRFNIIRSDFIKIHQAIHNNKIENTQVIMAAITKLLNNAEKVLALKIKKIILCIPSSNVKCVKRRVNIKVEEGSRRVMMSHVRTGLNQAIHSHSVEGFEFVNVGSVKYTVGGISSRTIPLDERVDSFVMDVDLLYADKDIVHSYVMCVEACGVSVLDICLDCFAVAEETASIENSMDKYIVLINLEKRDSVLSLYHKGNLIECENLKAGFNEWIEDIRKKHYLSAVESEAMLFENCFEEKGIYDDIVSYIWVDHEVQRQLTKIEVYNAVKDSVSNWIALVNETCEPIKDVGNCKIVISGSGADIIGFKSEMRKMILPSQIYIPSTIGAREGKFTACLGSLYCAKKWQEIKSVKEVSVEYNNMIAREVKREDEMGFTKKLKNILQVK